MKMFHTDKLFLQNGFIKMNKIFLQINDNVLTPKVTPNDNYEILVVTLINI